MSDFVVGSGGRRTILGEDGTTVIGIVGKSNQNDCAGIGLLLNERNPSRFRSICPKSLSNYWTRRPSAELSLWQGENKKTPSVLALGGVEHFFAPEMVASRLDPDGYFAGGLLTSFPAFFV